MGNVVMRIKENKIFLFVKKNWYFLVAIAITFFGASDVIKAYSLRISGDWCVATYYLLCGVTLFGFSLYMILIYLLDDLYCRISGDEPDKNKNENKE